MRQFTIITKDGSKWLSLTQSPIWGNEKEWMEEVLSEDLPYIGSRPDGTTLDESDVREVRQGLCEYTMKWITECDDDLPTYNRYRTVYTDAESHDHDISDDYWRKRCEAAERFIAKSPCDNDITPAQEAAYNEWHEIVNEESK